MTAKPTYRIASIPGDGIGPEVVSATIQAVTKLSQTLGTFDIDFTHIPWGTEYYKQHGKYVSDNCLDELRQLYVPFRRIYIYIYRAGMPR